MGYEGLVVGLGNPGQRYKNTRHNMGFQVADVLLAHQVSSISGTPSLVKEHKDFFLWEMHLKDSRWLITKPMTFMNRSGRAVALLTRKYGLEPQNILVLHDELDLPLGRMKFKFGGGLAGHNGLKSIAESIGSKEFYRLRMGIGRPDEDMEVTPYVLGGFSPAEKPLVHAVTEEAGHCVIEFCTQGFDVAVQKAHSFVFSEG